MYLWVYCIKRLQFGIGNKKKTNKRNRVGTIRIYACGDTSNSGTVARQVYELCVSEARSPIPWIGVVHFTKSLKAIATSDFAMKLNDITEEDIEILADSDAIVHRGRSYYNSGRIKHFEVNSQQIIAKIIGHYCTYNIKIEIVDGDIEADCDCPYGGPGCKHVAAALYKWI